MTRLDNTEWEPASGYSPQKHGKPSKWDWWLCRRFNGIGQMAEASNGRTRVFCSFEAARSAAEKLNRGSGK